MKLENKISLQFVVILLSIGGVLFITWLMVAPVFALAIHRLLDISMGSNHLLLYTLLILPFIGIFIACGLFIGRKISKPLFFMINWIEQLSDGYFEKPGTEKNSTSKFSAFAELELKLSVLTDRLNSTERKRKELEESRKNWTSGITHDLKTPLSYIKGYSAMIQSQYAWDAEEIKDFAQIIEEKSLHMERLIHDLSVVYEFDKSQIPLKMRTMSLIPFVEGVVADLQKHPLAKDYHVHLNTVDNQMIKLAFDENLLKRSLENLIMNALHHNPSGTTVIVTVGTKEDSAFIKIKDDGIGMDKKAMEQLFDRYYRGTPTDKTELGSGLGMLIAKQFVERLQGEIYIDSEPDQGTVITLLFPK